MVLYLLRAGRQNRQSTVRMKHMNEIHVPHFKPTVRSALKQTNKHVCNRIHLLHHLLKIKVIHAEHSLHLN